MVIERLVLGALETNCWLVAGSADGSLVVIDPADDADRLLEALEKRTVAAVVLTHGHFDHLGAARRVLEATGAPLLVHELDAARITTAEGSGGAMFGFFGHDAPAPDRLLTNGEVISASGGLELSVIHTPGHTAGSICLVGEGSLEGHLFSGDTLFAGSVGRTDFPGGDGRALRDSIAARLAPLADDTVVHPGHGPDTTIGRERKVNPFFPRA